MLATHLEDIVVFFTQINETFKGMYTFTLMLTMQSLPFFDVAFPQKKSCCYIFTESNQIKMSSSSTTRSLPTKAYNLIIYMEHLICKVHNFSDTLVVKIALLAGALRIFNPFIFSLEKYQ